MGEESEPIGERDRKDTDDIVINNNNDYNI